MMTVAITGADGLIGWHLSCYLHGNSDAKLIRGGRGIFKTAESLDDLVATADVIVHLAGVNRGPDEEVLAGNILLARSLAAAIERVARPIHVLFANSTHADGETAYGLSKREAARLLGAATDGTGGVLTDLVLPHVFGEGGRPFYNSVVSTFCHQLAIGEVPTIDRNGQLSLLHAQAVAALMAQCIEAPPTASQQLRPGGRSMMVSELLAFLQDVVSTYRMGIIPELSDDISLDLFNTYRSYLYPSIYPAPLTKRTDARGSLVEVVKGGSGGQSFVSDTHPTVVRGNHFHLRKVERFVVLRGQATIGIRRLFDDVVIDFSVDGETPTFVDIPTMHTHNLTNTGSTELVTLFWSNEIFDPEAPDTYVEMVNR
jgi:UDP-2-acetamido-2,6-beta-L-arabino-hexul-4-ose reductase